MTSDTTPLLSEARREHHDEDEPVPSKPDQKPARFRFWELIAFVIALLVTTIILTFAVWAQHTHQISHNAPAGKRNLVFMVSDGMGPASLSLTRSYRQFIDGLPEGDTLVLDKHFWGTSRTRSSNSLVTDSAAGATAFSCGQKSYNGAIAMLPDFKPCGTVMEAAKRAGYTTGLVVTTDITDATPACFASHVVIRVMNDEIARQEVGEGVLGRVVDLMFGGGRCHFLPNTTEGGCRLDDVDVTKIAQEKHGWTYARDRKAFDAMKGGDEVHLPMLGLFASTDVPFEIDRRHMNDVYPSLSEMAGTALRALERATKDSEKGFFLMIEASRIDHAGHINDPAAQVQEVLEYDKAFKTVLDFLDGSDTPGVLVATSDHETGGLATALQEPGHLPVYNWFPAHLANANASAELLSRRLADHLSSSQIGSRDDLRDWINTHLVIRGLGITDALSSELDALIDFPEASMNTFSAMISVRAHIGWSTHGHSAVDVNIYSSGGPGTEKLRGNVENTEIGVFLREYLGVDVDPITKELREKMDTDQAAEATAAQDTLGLGGQSTHGHWSTYQGFDPKKVPNGEMLNVGAA